MYVGTRPSRYMKLTLGRHPTYHRAATSRPAAGHACAGKLADGQAARSAADGVHEALPLEFEANGQKLPEPGSTRSTRHSCCHFTAGLLRGMELGSRSVV